MSETRKAFEALQGIDAREESADSPSTPSGVRCAGPASRAAAPPVSGRRVRFGGSNQPSGMDTSFPVGSGLVVEPFQLQSGLPPANRAETERPSAAVGLERIPPVEVHDEGDHVLVLAELPGVDPGSVEVQLTGDMLELSGTAPRRRYRAEVLLPDVFGSASLSHHLRRDLLSIRLQR